MYFAHDLGRAFARPIHTWASMFRTAWTHPFNPASVLPQVRAMAAAAELVERATAEYPKPAFGLDRTVVGGREVAVREQLIQVNGDRPIDKVTWSVVVQLERAQKKLDR